MKPFHTAITTSAALLTLAGTASAQLFGVSNGFGTAANNRIFQINPSNGDLSSIVPLTLSGFTVTNALALTAQPGTGTLFAVIQTGSGAGNRRLVTVDHRTGVCTLVGTLSNQIASIAFVGNTLYAVSGNGGNPAETLYTCNPSTGALTLAFALGNGADGEIIASHPSGLLYHSSGNGTAEFETVNPVTQVVTPLGIANGECFAMGWHGGLNTMYGADIGSQFYAVNLLTGARTIIGQMNDQLGGNSDCRGLAYIPPVTVYGVSNGRGTAALNRVFQVNPANGDLTNLVQMTMPGFTVTNALAVTTNPANGTLFAVIQTSNGAGNRRLVTLNPSTGVCTQVGSLSNQIATINFIGGTLYAVSGDGGTPSETLYTVNTANGALTQAFALGNGADGEIIAWHPSGVFYHSSGNTTALFESVNPFTQVVTPIGQTSSECLAMGWHPGLAQMLGSDLNSQLYTVDLATGARTTIGQMSDQLSNSDCRGFAIVVADAPGCGPADVGLAGGLAGADGRLDNNDFIAFINYFFTSNPAADLGLAGGLPGSDGQFDNNDFIAFIDAFFNAPASCRG